MRFPSLALLVLALVFGGCAAVDQSFSKGEIDASTSTVAPPLVVVSTIAAEAVTTTTTLSLTSATAPPIITTSTTEAESPQAQIVLSSDGLGVVSFGDRMDDALVILTDLLGPPTFDEVHTDVMTRFEADEAIPFGYYRRVGWSPPGLGLEFYDWDSLDWALEAPVFNYWWADGLLLRTAEGVGPGSLWSDMEAVYDDDAKAWEDCGENTGTIMYFFSIRSDSELWYHGWLTDDPADPTTLVEHMEAGIEAFSQGC